MVIYYRKLMGNGTVASKFRLGGPNPTPDHPPSPQDEPPAALAAPLETLGTHHESNCVRCYKLKKKCTRTYPQCEYCLKLGTECHYVDRKRKKHKLDDDGDGAEAEAERSRSGSIPDLSLQTFSIALLVNKDDTEELFRNIDLPSEVPPSSSAKEPKPQPTALISTKLGKKFMTLSKRIVALAVENHPRQKLHEDFLVVKAIEDVSLPSAFVHTFFANYEWKYPFLTMPGFLAKLENVSFTNETLVQLDVYLVMAVGCIIYDANHNTRHYHRYFSDALIESIVDMISYDIRSEEDLHTAHLLILLVIYAVNVSNTNLAWNIVGFLNRLIIFLTDFTGKNNQCMRKRCFWTIFNLDKELSLALDKASQFMPTRIIKLDSQFADTLAEGEQEKTAQLMSQAVQLHTLQDRMLSLKLGLTDVDAQTLKTFSADLETWRVSALLMIHNEYAELPLLTNFIGLINLDYYYLLIELDQLSSTELFQFTLQFLSNSFSLLLSELTEKKGVVGTSLYSLFWFVKFFKVVEYNLELLTRVLASDVANADLSLRLNDFNSNVQLIINLLKFLTNSRHKPEHFVDKLEAYTRKLLALNMKLVMFNPMTAEKKDVAALAADVGSILGKD